MTTITINGQPVEATRIDELNQTLLQTRDHVIPAMHDGQTVRVSVTQILKLILREDLAGKLLAEDATYDPGTAGPLHSETVQAALDEIAQHYISSKLQDLNPAAQAQARANIGLSYADETAKAAFRGNLDISNAGMFIKADPGSPAFIKTGNGTLSVKAGTVVEVDGNLITFAADTAISMPSLTPGDDVAIWVRPDGQIVATLNHVLPPVTGSRKIGGAHYALGGNATAFNTGGNSTPQINEFSLWDLKFRPACPDPRGMALVAGHFWCDIYLLGVNHHTDGTSRAGVTIADGSSPPKVPVMFGGNGSSVYGSLNWWEAAEVMQSHGKQLLSYAEFAAAMYGTTEETSGGTDPVSTILRQAYTSKWGIMLATGNLWVWGRDFGGDHAAASYTANTGGRGSTQTLSNVALLGGSWDSASYAGSRASVWYASPTSSFGNLGARGRSDHLCHE